LRHLEVSAWGQGAADPRAGDGMLLMGWGSRADRRAGVAWRGSSALFALHAPGAGEVRPRWCSGR